MARLARVVVPGVAHHVTQRGNGRARTFFGDADYALYRDLLAGNCRAAEVEAWAWCRTMCTSYWCRPIPTGCAARLRVCIVAMPASSRRGADAAGTFGRAASAP